MHRSKEPGSAIQVLGYPKSEKIIKDAPAAPATPSGYKAQKLKRTEKRSIFMMMPWPTTCTAARRGIAGNSVTWGDVRKELGRSRPTRLLFLSQATRTIQQSTRTGMPAPTVASMLGTYASCFQYSCLKDPQPTERDTSLEVPRGAIAMLMFFRSELRIIVCMPHTKTL